MSRRKRFADGSQSHALGTALIIIVMFLSVGGVMAWMNSVGLLMLPPPLNHLFDRGEVSGGEPMWELGELSELVRGERHPDEDTVVLTLDAETLLDAFLAEARAPGLYVSGRVSYYDDGAAVPHRVIYRRSGEDYRAEIYEDDSTARLETLKIRTGTSVYIRDGQSGEFRSLPADGSISGEHEAGIPSVDEVMAAVAAFPRQVPADTTAAETSAEASAETAAETTAETTAADTTAETEPPLYTDCSLALVTNAAGSVYYVQFTYADIGVREEYTVSPDFGIVLSARTVAGGMPVYAFEALTVSTDPADWQSAAHYDVTR